MLITKIDQLESLFSHVKENTREIDISKNKTALAVEGYGNHSILFDTPQENKELPIKLEALDQYLKRAVGRYGPPTWNLANKFIRTKDQDNNTVYQRDPTMVKSGLDLINRKISLTNGQMRLHELDGNILGVTSTNYPKIHDLDLMHHLNDQLGRDSFQRGFWNHNRSIMSYKFGDFRDQTGLDWDLNLRIENNEFGRHSIVFGGEVVRVICTNGMVSTKIIETMKIKHYGEINLKTLGKIINAIIDQEIKLKEMIEDSISKEFIPNDDFFAQIRKKLQINKDQLAEILKHVEKEEPELQNTFYGLANGISAYANDFPEKEEQSDNYYNYQEMAGLVMAMQQIEV